MGVEEARAPSVTSKRSIERNALRVVRDAALAADDVVARRREPGSERLPVPDVVLRRVGWFGVVAEQKDFRMRGSSRDQALETRYAHVRRIPLDPAAPIGREIKAVHRELQSIPFVERRV